MAESKDHFEWINVTHDGIKFAFEKTDDSTAHYRYARTALGGANSDRTKKYDLPEHPSEKDIPEPVINEVRNFGYEIR